MNFEDFIHRLRSRLKEPLPGEEAQFRMAPPRRLTLKEYYELRNQDPKQSAVLMCLYPKQNSVYTVMMLRPPAQGVHSDQVSFPGGGVEINDESLEKTALREAHEEIGINPSQVNVIGRLSPVYIPVSNYIVQPVVGFSNDPPEFTVNVSEVIRVIETDSMILLNDSIKGNFTFKSGTGIEIEAPFYEIQELKIWGATAMILSEFESILQEIQFPM